MSHFSTTRALRVALSFCLLGLGQEVDCLNTKKTYAHIARALGAAGRSAQPMLARRMLTTASVNSVNTAPAMSALIQRAQQTPKYARIAASNKDLNVLGANLLETIPEHSATGPQARIRLRLDTTGQRSYPNRVAQFVVPAGTSAFGQAPRRAVHSSPAADDTDAAEAIELAKRSPAIQAIADKNADMRILGSTLVEMVNRHGTNEGRIRLRLDTTGKNSYPNRIKQVNVPIGMMSGAPAPLGGARAFSTRAGAEQLDDPHQRMRQFIWSNKAEVLDDIKRVVDESPSVYSDLKGLHAFRMDKGAVSDVLGSLNGPSDGEKLKRVDNWADVDTGKNVDLGALQHGPERVEKPVTLFFADQGGNFQLLGVRPRSDNI